MLKRAVVFASGSGSNFQALCEAVNNNELSLEICLLVCDKDNAYVIERAKKYKIEVLLINYSINSTFEIESMLLDKLSELKINLLILAGFLRKLSPLIIKNYHHKIINIHPSLLPKYKGLHAIEQALANNESDIGVSVHYVDELLDNGPIIMQDKVSVVGLNNDEVYQKVHDLEHVLFVKALKKVLEEY